MSRSFSGQSNRTSSAINAWVSASSLLEGIRCGELEGVSCGATKVKSCLRQ